MSRHWFGQFNLVPLKERVRATHNLLINIWIKKTEIWHFCLFYTGRVHQDHTVWYPQENSLPHNVLICLKHNHDNLAGLYLTLTYTCVSVCLLKLCDACFLHIMLQNLLWLPVVCEQEEHLTFFFSLCLSLSTSLFGLLGQQGPFVIWSTSLFSSIWPLTCQPVGSLIVQQLAMVRSNG